EDQANVVALPGLRDRGIDGPGLAVPQLARLAVAAARAEDRLERRQLSAAAHDLFHVGEAAIPERWFPLLPCDWPRLAVLVGEHVHTRFVEVDPLKIAEIDRIRCSGPDAAKGVGIGHLQPQARPAARRMASHKSPLRFADGAIGLLDMRDQLL